jgi:hypothetical protein
MIAGANGTTSKVGMSTGQTARLDRASQSWALMWFSSQYAAELVEGALVPVCCVAARSILNLVCFTTSRSSSLSSSVGHRGMRHEELLQRFLRIKFLFWHSAHSQHSCDSRENFFLDFGIARSCNKRNAYRQFL